MEKESRLLIVLKEGKVEFQAENTDMVELATMCGALEQLMGVEAIRRGKSLDDVKDSIKALNKRELGTMVSVLQNMKDSSSKGTRNRQRQTGNVGTENQRKKIYKLTEELGWDKKARVNGLCKKMFKVSSVEWLNYQQCSKLIEALKSMVEREKGKA